MKNFQKMVLMSLLSIMTSNLIAQKIEDVSKEENKFIYSNSIKLFLGDSICVVTEMVDKNLTGFTLVVVWTPINRTFLQTVKYT